MAVPELHPTGCERAREWASLGLDGELSEFERALLRAHLDRCPSCSAYTETVEQATAELRRAPLVPLTGQVVLPRRRRGRVVPLRAIQVAGAAAALAAAVGFGALLGAHSSQPGSPLSVRATALKDSITEDTLIREPRLAMINAAKGIGTQRGIGIVDF